MRSFYDGRLAKYRIVDGFHGSDESYKFTGAFRIPFKFDNRNQKLIVVSTGNQFRQDNFNDINNWEHVSVSHPNRCPTWDEMNFIKGVFWSDYETVIQYHPSKKHYINNHKTCLHMWKPIHFKIKLPPELAVGVKF
jgi:hypothetical protein